MSIRQRKFFVPVLLATLVIGTLALVVARSGSNRNRLPSPQVSSPTFLQTQTQTQTKSSNQGKGQRNLSLHPEAFNLARRLGQRFAPGKREQSSTTATLTIGSQSQSVSTTRKQTDDGEQIEIKIAGSQGSLTWDAKNGSYSSGPRANEGDRDLIERLVLDSPDQFVLAQMRGASYYIVARNVRPNDAREGYTGPTWTVVRVDDPERDEAKRPQSPWRLYYINTGTGLIDRIVSQSQDQRVTAELTWTESNGERIPAQIIWTRQGQLLMRYELANFSHADQKGAR